MSGASFIMELRKGLIGCEIRFNPVLFKLELATGMRRADIVAVERENINEGKKYIDFIETKKKRSNINQNTTAKLASVPLSRRCYSRITKALCY